MAGKFKKGFHHLYSYSGQEVYPGTIEERSIERIGGEVSERRVAWDVRLSGPLIEEFPDDEFKKSEFKWRTGREIYGLLRQRLILQKRINDPISNAELEQAAIAEGYQRIHVRMALRDAWKMGLTRRFIRGRFAWGLSSRKVNGKSFGIHYIMSKQGEQWPRRKR